MAEGIFYAGINDKEIDLFEGQYRVPAGISYNSWVILDEKVAVTDTADVRKGAEYMAALEQALQGREPDYLIISHVEPDHASSLKLFLDRYPGVCLVGNAKTWAQLGYYFDLSQVQTLTVKEGEKLSLGKHELTFIMAPMVHWPEVMMYYESATRTLFSADGFGTFGALTGEKPTPESWDGEARRYYFNIVGKYGVQVTAVLKKAAALDIARIHPLHGPVLEGDMLAHAIRRYTTWASYAPEAPEAVLVAYASIYGNTAGAAREMAEMLKARGAEVIVTDLAREDQSAALAQAFRCGKIVLAASTMDGGVMPFMADFLHHLKIKTFQKRTVALMENGSWAPMAAKVMRASLEEMKDIAIVEPVTTIRGAVKDVNRAQMAAAVEAILG